MLRGVDERFIEPRPAVKLDYESPPPPRRGLGQATPVAILATAIPILGSVTMLIAGPLLAGWLRAQGTAGLIYFTVTFALLGAVAFAPTYTTSVIAGWTFGFARGFPAVIIGTVIGVILLRSIRNGIIVIGVPGLAYNMFVGLIILVAVILQALAERRRVGGE